MVWWPAGTRTPYSSALSSFIAGQTYAAPYCNDKACVGGSRYNLSCGKVVGYHCQKFGGGICSHNPC